MQKIYFLLVGLFVFTTAFAQQATVSGTVTTPEGKAVSGGDVFLLKAADSSLVKYAPVKDGAFALDAVPAGQYLLKISSLGFVEYRQAVVLDANKTMAINLQQQNALMAGVTVKATRKTFSSSNGNMKVNIEGSPFATVSSATELLGKLPKLQVDPTGESLTMLGKGEPLIYIDNQRSAMTDMAALPVGDIKSIELISNPPARYEAQGRAVILITRKTNRHEGWKSDVSETVTYREYANNRLSVGSNYKKKQLELKSNFQYNQLKVWESNAFDFAIPSAAVRTNYDVTAVTTRPQFIFGEGIFYQLTPRSYVSANTTARVQQETYPITTASYLKNGSVEDYVNTDNRNDQRRLFTTSNINYSHDLQPVNSQLFMGAQYSTYRRRTHSHIYNSYNSDPAELSQDRYQDNRIRSLSAKADFAKQFKQGFKWESGLQYTAIRSASLLSLANYNPVSGGVSDYRYKEDNGAAYTQVSGTIRKVDIAAGLRVEQVAVQSGPVNSPLLVNSRKTQLFPRLSINIPVDSLQSINLAYAKTISRPDVSSVSNQTTYINPFFEWSSNVNLQPTMMQEVSANYQYKDYSLQLSVYKSAGPVYADFEYDPVLVSLRRRDRNYEVEQGMSLTLNVPFTYKIWRSTNVLMGYLMKIKDPAAAQIASKPGGYLYSNNQFGLPKGFALVVSGWAYARSREGVFVRKGIYTVDTTVTKKFSDKLSCSISANNLFNSSSPMEQFTISDIVSNGRYLNARDFSVGIKYSFGKLKEAGFKNKDVDENMKRLN